MTKWYLFSKLGQKGSEPCTIKLTDGTHVDGIIQGVERESGSGTSFIVRMIPNGRSHSVNYYVKTVD